MSDLFKGLKNFVPQVTAELERLGTQGSMEFASALFNGQAFVPYGPGQYPPSPELENGAKEQQAAEPQRESDGMEM